MTSASVRPTTRIVFMKAAPPYYPGDVAAFSEPVAARYVRAGAARPYDGRDTRRERQAATPKPPARQTSADVYKKFGYADRQQKPEPRDPKTVKK